MMRRGGSMSPRLIKGPQSPSPQAQTARLRLFAYAALARTSACITSAGNIAIKACPPKYTIQL